MCWSVNVRPANDPRVGVSKALIELQINAKFTNIRNYFGDRKKLRANRVRQRMKPRAGPSTEGMPLTSHPHFCTSQPSGTDAHYCSNWRVPPSEASSPCSARIAARVKALGGFGVP